MEHSPIDLTAEVHSAAEPWSVTATDPLPPRYWLTGATLASARPEACGSLWVCDDCHLAIENGRLLWIGSEDSRPEVASEWPTYDLGGRLLTPPLIDCHTHLIFGGHRAAEFKLRMEGASYEEIARGGGGILSTVRATREAAEHELLANADARLRHLLREGVRTVEIKSGYGLDRETELRMLRVARELGSRYRSQGLRVLCTYLAAHSVPPEYGADRERYLDDVCESWLPAGQKEGLVDAVDVFCETVAFDLQETARVLTAASDLGLPVRVHAEQLSSSGAAALAAQHGALSADHLEYLDEHGVRSMARAGTVAVLLPGAFYSLRERRKPPVEALRAAEVPMALATDWNPGTSPLGSLLLAMNLGCTLFDLTPDEALLAVTENAARALGCWPERGALFAGSAADFLIWDLHRPEELSYRMAGHEPPQVVVAGRLTALAAEGTG